MQFLTLSHRLPVNRFNGDVIKSGRKSSMNNLNGLNPSTDNVFKTVSVSDDTVASLAAHLEIFTT